MCAKLQNIHYTVLCLIKKNTDQNAKVYESGNKSKYHNHRSNILSKSNINLLWIKILHCYSQINEFREAPENFLLSLITQRIFSLKNDRAYRPRLNQSLFTASLIYEHRTHALSMNLQASIPRVAVQHV